MKTNFNGTLIDYEIPKIMGILNVTPDSFFDGGTYKNEKSILNKVENMLSEGADFIDIGGQSTRPNAEFLSAKKEIERVIPVIKLIKKHFPETILSIDTFWSEVMYNSVNEGVSFINDVSAGKFDPNVFEVVSKLKVPYILTHNPDSEKENSIIEINKFLFKKINQLIELNINDIIIDPGFGFSKSLEDNYKILNKLDFICYNKYPILVGISRKSMIYKLLNSNPKEIESETCALNLYALTKGASILRVHDVKKISNIINIFKKLIN